VQKLLRWKSNKYYLFWVCVCSLDYPARNALTPYCGLPGCKIVLNIRLSHKGHDFFKKVTGNKIGAFLFILQLLSETLLTLRRNE
jgi:hypothetical protein